MENPPNLLSAPPCDMAAEALACIDEEINCYMLRLSKLRTRRNTFFPIFRLPPETLANIFVHGARDYYEECDRFAFGVPTWVKVSHVCRHWRDVALNCPTLWTYYFVASERWTDDLLARSKHASLKIRMYHHARSLPEWSSLVGKVMNHMERIQELRLDFPSDILSTKLPLPLHAPRLQDLELKVLHRAAKASWPSTLFDGNTPALRTLKLSNFPVPWYSLQQSGLTTLSLNRVPQRIQQNVAEFLAILVHMQDLTDLHLCDALTSARNLLAGGVFNVSQKINLPRLARFSIAAPVSTVVALLSCINIPLKTQTKLTFQSESNPSIDDYAPIPSTIVQRLSLFDNPASSSPIIRTLVVVSTSRGLKLIFNTLERDCDPRSLWGDDDWACNLPLEINVGIHPSITETDGNRITSDICCSIPSTNIQSLHFENPPFSPAFWRRMLGHFQGLRFMKLSNGRMPELASVLSLSADELEEIPSGPLTGDGDPTRHMFAPALEELKLSCIIFSTKSDPWLAIPRSTLRDALSTRGKLRDGFTMYDCRIDCGYDELGKDRHRVCYDLEVDTDEEDFY